MAQSPKIKFITINAEHISMNLIHFEILSQVWLGWMILFFGFSIFMFFKSAYCREIVSNCQRVVIRVNLFF